MREQIDNFKKLLSEGNIDKTFKNKVLLSLKDKLNGYGRLPKEIKDLVKFNQIPIDVYQKINDGRTRQPTQLVLLDCQLLKQKLRLF